MPSAIRARWLIDAGTPTRLPNGPEFDAMDLMRWLPHQIIAQNLSGAEL